MGHLDNRRTPKMRQRKRQAKLKARLKRRAEEKRQTRAGAPPPKKK
ncbi:MAG: hypothetical protein H6713_04930 [Myxococcales bacterium]|nr:hypothetical protein [Myxococcales bacterium]MCB9749337.1 hypothetical protein [Myxococcales bacterium]